MRRRQNHPPGGPPHPVPRSARAPLERVVPDAERDHRRAGGQTLALSSSSRYLYRKPSRLLNAIEAHVGPSSSMSLLSKNFTRRIRRLSSRPTLRACEWHGVHRLHAAHPTPDRVSAPTLGLPLCRGPSPTTRTCSSPPSRALNSLPCHQSGSSPLPRKFKASIEARPQPQVEELAPPGIPYKLHRPPTSGSTTSGGHSSAGVTNSRCARWKVIRETLRSLILWATCHIFASSTQRATPSRCRWHPPPAHQRLAGDTTHLHGVELALVVGVCGMALQLHLHGGLLEIYCGSRARSPCLKLGSGPSSELKSDLSGAPRLASEA